MHGIFGTAEAELWEMLAFGMLFFLITTTGISDEHTG